MSNIWLCYRHPSEGLNPPNQTLDLFCVSPMIGTDLSQLPYISMI